MSDDDEYTNKLSLVVLRLWLAEVRLLDPEGPTNREPIYVPVSEIEKHGVTAGGPLRDCTCSTCDPLRRLLDAKYGPEDSGSSPIALRPSRRWLVNLWLTGADPVAICEHQPPEAVK